MQPLLVPDDIWRALQLLSAANARPHLAVFIDYSDAIDATSRKYGDKKPVFVSNVECVNGPDGTIPSVARFYRVNHKAIELRADSMYFSLSKGTFHFIYGFSDWKLGPVINKRGSEFLNSLEPCVVQSAIEIVNGISEHEGNVVESRAVGKIMSEYFSTSFRVNIDSSRVGCMQKNNPAFDVRDVLIGPFDLQVGIG